MNVRRAVVAATAIFVTAHATVNAQNAMVRIADVQRAPYDVASIRRNTSGRQMGRAGDYPGRFARSNASLRQILQSIFGLRPYQVVGGADWIDRDRFDVLVSAPDVPVQRMRGAALNAIHDRFSLHLRRETRDMDVYELVRLRNDATLGPGLRRRDDECTYRYNAPAGALRGTCLPWRRVALLMTAVTDRPVIDRSGLDGNFDVNLQWTPDLQSEQQPSDTRVGLLTAVREQFGLRLERARAPVEVLVIGAAEPPTAN